MKWIIGISVIAVMAGFAATMTIPAQTITPDEATLKLFPRETDGLAFVDAAGLRSAPLFQEMITEQLQPKIPLPLQEFSKATDFAIDRDLEHLTIGRIGPRQMLVIAQARYDRFRAEQFFNDKQVPAETYLGRVLYRPDREGAISFIDNLIIGGHADAVKKAIDRLAAPAESVLQNTELLGAIKTIEAGNQVWAAGDFDGDLLAIQREAPAQLAELVKSLKSGTYQMRIDQDVHARASGTFTDTEKARTTSDLFRGLVAAAKLQESRHEDMIRLLDGVRIRNSGASMTVNFDASGELVKKLQAPRTRAN